MSLTTLIDAIQSGVEGKENLGTIKGRIMAARQEAVSMERDYSELQTKYDKLVEVNSNQQTEISHLKTIVSPAPTLPQKDIDLMVQISNAGRTVREKLPNDLQRRAELLEDSGYLEGGKYSAITGHEIRLSPKGREFLDKAGLL